MPKHLIQDIIVKKKKISQARKISEDIWDKAIKINGEKEKSEMKTGEFRKKIKFRFKFFRPWLEFPHSKPKIKFILAIIALIALGGYIILNKFSSIAVEITLRQEFIDVDAVFRASVEPNSDVIPLEVMQLSREEKESIPTTGVQKISRKASGQIIIYNAYSSQPQSLVKDTRFETLDGKIYRINRSIVVPGAKVEEGKIISSEIEATIIADKPGEEYNIGFTDFSIPGFKGTAKYEKFYGRSKTEIKGGFVGDAPVVSKDDIDILESSLKDKIKNYLLKTAINPKPDEFLFYENAKKIIFGGNKNKPNPGDEAKEIEIKEDATFFGFLLKKSDIDRALGGKYFDSAQEIEVVNASGLDFELKNFTATDITFGLKGQAHFVWKIDETSLKNDLIKEKGNSDSIFKKYVVIKKARIIFKPNWWRRIPENSARITINRILEKRP